MNMPTRLSGNALKDFFLDQRALRFTGEIKFNFDGYKKSVFFQGGEITHAEKRDDVWVGTDFQAYAIRYRVSNSIKSDWATIAVRVAD